MSRDFLETLVEGQIMSDRVLPTGRGCLIIRIVMHDPVVDLIDGKRLLGG